MTEAARGRDENVNAEMPIALFVDISALLERLSNEVVDRKPGENRHERALQRIADLDIRSASLLLEMNAWKRIVAELQAIAQDTLGQPRRPARYTPPSDDDESGPGLRY
ncbi:hypothetical protein [Sphingomonas montana]|uniref:hypothetical protein n=1 Tax=Sphingomonas montana TaxID=1843236 RepID=UPI00096CD2B1|nr:hypothetical protein [Sphingomonas montana]